MSKSFAWLPVLALGAASLELVALWLGRSRTRSLEPPGRALLVYDDDCGLCHRLATLVQERASEDLELVPFSDLPRPGLLVELSEDEVRTSAHLVDPGGIEYHGGESVTRALRLVPGGQVAVMLDWPVLRGLRELGYRLIAWQRGRLSRRGTISHARPRS